VHIITMKAGEDSAVRDSPLYRKGGEVKRVSLHETAVASTSSSASGLREEEERALLAELGGRIFALNALFRRKRQRSVRDAFHAWRADVSAHTSQMQKLEAAEVEASVGRYRRIIGRLIDKEDVLREEVQRTSKFEAKWRAEKKRNRQLESQRVVLIVLCCSVMPLLSFALLCHHFDFHRWEANVNIVCFWISIMLLLGYATWRLYAHVCETEAANDKNRRFPTTTAERDEERLHRVLREAKVNRPRTVSSSSVDSWGSPLRDHAAATGLRLRKLRLNSNRSAASVDTIREDELAAEYVF